MNRLMILTLQYGISWLLISGLVSCRSAVGMHESAKPEQTEKSLSSLGAASMNAASGAKIPLGTKDDPFITDGVITLLTPEFLNLKHKAVPGLMPAMWHHIKLASPDVKVGFDVGQVVRCSIELLSDRTIQIIAMTRLPDLPSPSTASAPKE